MKPLINSRLCGMELLSISRIGADWCIGCQTVSHHNKKVFRKFDELTERFDHVHVDLVGPLPYSDGFKYLLTCVDRFYTLA